MEYPDFSLHGKRALVTGPVLSLASPAADMIHGAVLTVDGGYTAQ